MKSASSWITFLIDTLMVALPGARTRLSTPIHIWAGTSGSPGQGLYLGDYGSRIPSSNASTDKVLSA
jgi:hypothetical protein